MKKGERGFTLIELIVGLSIIFLVSGAGAMATFQLLKGTEVNSTHMTAVRQVQNAGYWISHDTRMAQTVHTVNLTLPVFLVFNWTEGDTQDEYEIVYTLDDVAGSTLKKLHRNQSVNGGVNTTTFVAQYIDPDAAKTSCQYISGKLTLTITATAGAGMAEQSETRTYQFVRRSG